jgi:hypothetical protein
MSNKSPPHITREAVLLDAVRKRIRRLPLPTDASDTTVAEILGDLDDLNWLLRASRDRRKVRSVLKQISSELILAMLREIGRSSNWSYPSIRRTGIRWLALARPYEILEKRAA